MLVGREKDEEKTAVQYVAIVSRITVPPFCCFLLELWYLLSFSLSIGTFLYAAGWAGATLQ